MSRLLKANFSRLFESLIFKLGMISSVGLAVFSITVRYLDNTVNADLYAEYGYTFNAEGLIFVGSFFLMFAMAVFVGLFVGTDYSDGTIRNKIMVGHSRFSIYMSNYITCAVTGIIFNISYIVVALAYGQVLLGGTEYPLRLIMICTCVSITALIALISMMLLLSMLISRKAAASVILLLMSMLLLMTAMTVQSRLDAPEYFGSYIMGDEGELINEEIKNPKYLTGAKREAYEFIADFIPSSQLYQVVTTEVARPWRIVICDAFIFLVTTGVGVCAFRRKDLK